MVCCVLRFDYPAVATFTVWLRAHTLLDCWFDTHAPPRSVGLRSLVGLLDYTRFTYGLPAHTVAHVTLLITVPDSRYTPDSVTVAD